MTEPTSIQITEMEDYWIDRIPQFSPPRTEDIRDWLKYATRETVIAAVDSVSVKVLDGRITNPLFARKLCFKYVELAVRRECEEVKRDSEAKQQALIAKGSNGWGSKLAEQMHGAWAIMCAGDWKSITLANNAAAIAKCERRKRRYGEHGMWVRYVLSVPHACRIVTFSEASEHLTDDVYFKLLWRVFVRVGVRRRNDSWVYDGLLVNLLKAKRPGIERFCFTPKDAAYWQSLPEKVTAYRGHGQVNRAGIYWSLDRETAAGYAAQYGHLSSVEERVLEKSKCVYVGGVQQQILYLDYANGDAA
jgi:hypothetical protein